MEIWQAVLLGIIQGITEWFPVSSSGHLVLSKNYLGIEPSLTFDVFVHFGSAAVILFIFRKEVKRVLVAFFSSVAESKEEGLSSFTKTSYRKLALFIIIGSIPTGILGLIISGFYEGPLSEPLFVGTALLITGLVLITTKFYHGERPQNDMNTMDALIIGTMQGLAAVPGISRSGFTISSSLIRGLKREVAARYSFLLFLPAITAAGLLKLNDLGSTSIEYVPLLIGTATAMLVGYITIKALLSLIQKGKFYAFSIYCFIVGMLVIIL